MKFIKSIIYGLIITIILVPCLAALPVITINVDAALSSSFFTFIRAGLYFLPLGTVTAILGIQISIWLFRVIVAILKTIWDVLPFA